MAIRQTVVSDISGEDIPDNQHVKLMVEHPDFGFTLQLDASFDEAEKLQNTNLRLVKFVIHAPNVPAREVTVESKVLDKLFSGVDFNHVLEGAKRVEVPRMVTATSAAARKAASPRAAAAGDAKLDYTSPEHAGDVHRGRVTDAEATYVRENLDAVNKRLTNEGRPTIDPSNPIMKKRYNF